TLPVAAATVANDLVFSAGIDGILSAHLTGTGEQVWTFQAENGFNAPPAVAGDWLFIGAGAPRIEFSHAPGTTPPPDADADAEGTTGPQPVAKLYAFRIGGAEPGSTEEPGATAGATAEPTHEGTAEPTAEGTAPATEAPSETAAATEPAGTPGTTGEPGGDAVSVNGGDLFFDPAQL